MAQIELVLADYKAALKSLGEGVPKVNSLLERDGAIHRFEYTIELSWKLLQVVLGARQLSVRSPGTVYREAYKEGLIEDVGEWLDYWRLRNLTTHVYREMTAEEVYRGMEGFIRLANKLVEVIEDQPEIAGKHD